MNDPSRAEDWRRSTGVRPCGFSRGRRVPTRGRSSFAMACVVDHAHAGAACDGSCIACLPVDPATFRYPSTSQPWLGREIHPGNAHGVLPPFAVLLLPAAFEVSPSRYPHMPFAATTASTSVCFFRRGIDRPHHAESAVDRRRSTSASGYSHRRQSVPARRVVDLRPRLPWALSSCRVSGPIRLVQHINVPEVRTAPIRARIAHRPPLAGRIRRPSAPDLSDDMAM